MTTRTYVTKSGDTYEWEETPEVLSALKQLHETVKQNENASNTQSTTVG